MTVCNYDTSVSRIIHMYISISLVFRYRYKALFMCLITLAVQLYMCTMLGFY